VDNGGIRTRDLWILIPVTVIGRPAPPGGAADEEIETDQALSQLSYVVLGAPGGIRTHTAQLLRLATPSSWSTGAKENGAVRET
jgi:hypothetical protein